MKELTCIVCPNGCKLRALEQDGRVTVTGALCRRGEAFATQELTRPMRSLTTTVATVFADTPRLSVRTKGEIPKGKLPEAMALINRVCLDRRVTTGEVVLRDLFGTDVIATADL